MAQVGITRHYATIANGRWGTRQVHYRRAGSGPALLILHQSPASSRDFIPLIERWASKFSIIAPDTPGNGLSDPLGVDHAEMEDFAEANIEFLDAIGVVKTAVYGVHTGAMATVAIAHRYPERVSAVVANGFVIMGDAERQEFVDNYLPPFAPKWDGSHLSWLWARMREQLTFFPWYKSTLAARMDIDMPSPEVLTRSAVEFLRAGDHYRVPYRAAFTYRGDKVLPEIEVPALITAPESDILHEHLGRIRNPSPNVTVKSAPTADDAIDGALHFLERHPALDGPPLVATQPIGDRMWNQMVDVPGGQLRVRRNIAASGRTVVVQHDAASASDTVEPVSKSLIGHRPVLAVDLPGHGESDNTIGERDVTVARYAEVLAQALESLGLDEIDFYGMWGGGLVGLEMVNSPSHPIRHLVMSNVLYHSDAEKAELQANYTPKIVPDWYGGHLLMCWHLMRNQGLFWPWYKTTREGILRQEPYIDANMVHGRVVNMLKAPEMWRLAYQSHFAYPTHDKLQGVKVPTLLCSPEWDPNFGHTAAAARAAPHCEYRVLPDGMGDWAPAFLDFLST